MGEIKIAKALVVGESGRKIPLGIRMRRWEDNIK
jgi:hypothetical protein